MKTNRLLLILALAAVMTGGVKPKDPTEIRFSILGDSYSAYAGTVDPETNDVFPLYDSIGVTSPEQMWWYKVATKTGWTMERNNSFSGALICNENYVNYYGPHSFLHRMDDLGQPDVIFVFGATNDVSVRDENNVPIVQIGDYVYGNWTEEQLCTFRPALACLFEKLKQMYPLAELYFMLDMDLGSGGIDVDRRDLFIGSIHSIASRYNVKCIDLEDIRKELWHPNALGQESIARQVLEAVETDFNV